MKFYKQNFQVKMNVLKIFVIIVHCQIILFPINHVMYKMFN